MLELELIPLPIPFLLLELELIPLLALARRTRAHSFALALFVDVFVTDLAIPVTLMVRETTLPQRSSFVPCSQSTMVRLTRAGCVHPLESEEVLLPPTTRPVHHDS